MSFIQGNINSKEDLIEAMDAMREMLTQGDPKTELELELAETKHKLAGIKGEVIGGDYYTYVGILHSLRKNLESRIQKLEEANKAPQEDGYDDLEDEDDEEPAELTSEVFLEEILEKINARVQSEVDDLRNNPWKGLKG